MKYFNAVILNDGETYTDVCDSYVVLNAFEDEETGELSSDNSSLYIPIQELINLYIQAQTTKPTSLHSSWE